MELPRPIARFPEAVYSSAEIQVGPGGRCLLYTDGILEAANAALEQFGTQTQSVCATDEANDIATTPRQLQIRAWRNDGGYVMPHGRYSDPDGSVNVVDTMRIKDR